MQTAGSVNLKNSPEGGNMVWDPEKYREKREKVLGVRKRGVSFGSLTIIVSCVILLSMASCRHSSDSFEVDGDDNGTSFGAHRLGPKPTPVPLEGQATSFVCAILI